MIKKFIQQVVYVYCREFKMVLHDQGIMIFLVVLPLMYPVLYALIYNEEIARNISTVVVDSDRSELSREYVRNLNATQAIWVKGYAADMAEAKRAMFNHDCYAIVEIPEGFGRKIGQGEQAPAAIYVESSLMLRYRNIFLASSGVSQAMGAELMAKAIDRTAPLAETLVTGDLLPVENIALGNTKSGFGTFIMGGVLMVIIQQSIVLAVGMAGGAKRERPELIGYDGVNQVKGVGRTMLGHMLCYFTFLMVPILFLTHYVPLIFQFPLLNDGWDVFAFLVPFVLASFGLGYCIQAFVWERESIFVIWVATSIVFLFCSGLTWPRSSMTGFWLWLSDVVPATWAVNGFLRMHTDGATLAQVSGCWWNQWICAAVYLTLGYCVERWVVRPSIRNGSLSYDRVRRSQI